ncbi:MAG: HigA family addiction module antidote protein [Nitrospinae bacterium]|nr:HigA family addiction module antidote protein [Nitrospinota bacterium]
MRTEQKRFNPEYTVAPGETLRETLAALGMSQAELARRTGRPLKTINGIAQGKIEITPETALQLERALGVPAGFWTNLERLYRDGLARLADRTALDANLDFLELVPFRELMKRGWIEDRIEKVQILQAVLNFFGVASPNEWKSIWSSPQAAYRHSPSCQSDIGAVAAWLRKGQLIATESEHPTYDEKMFRSELGKIKKLTALSPGQFVPRLKEHCQSSGVILALVKEFKAMSIHGATHWYAGKPIIQLTLRYKTNDHFWFSFFHEAAHILIHGRKSVFLENKETPNDQEKEANIFASNLLFPPNELRSFISQGRFTPDSIKTIAIHLGIAPGIVVGRLQYEKLVPWRSSLNRLKESYSWGAAN